MTCLVALASTLVQLKDLDHLHGGSLVATEVPDRNAVRFLANPALRTKAREGLDSLWIAGIASSSPYRSKESEDAAHTLNLESWLRTNFQASSTD